MSTVQLSEEKVAVFPIQNPDGNLYDKTSFGWIKGSTPNNQFLLLSRVSLAIEYLRWSAGHYQDKEPIERGIRVLKLGLTQDNEPPNEVGYYTTDQTKIDTIETAFEKATRDDIWTDLKGNLSLPSVQATSETISGRMIDNLHGAASTYITGIVDWAVHDVLDYNSTKSYVRDLIFGDVSEDTAMLVLGEESITAIYAVEHERKKKIHAYRADHAYSPFVDDLTNVYIQEELYQQEEAAFRESALYKECHKKLLRDKVKPEDYAASKAKVDLLKSRS